MKSTTKIIKIIFISIFILQMAGLIVLLFSPQISQAADIKFAPQITIPNSDFIAGVSSTVSSASIGKYIQAIYKYGIGIVGILATVVMMFGGFLYLTAAGDNSKISEAKEWIKASLTGLVIAMSSYMILATVNPALITLKMKDVAPIGKLPDVIYKEKGWYFSYYDSSKKTVIQNGPYPTKDECNQKKQKDTSGLATNECYEEKGAEQITKEKNEMCAALGGTCDAKTSKCSGKTEIASNCGNPNLICCK